MTESVTTAAEPRALDVGLATWRTMVASAVGTFLLWLADRTHIKIDDATSALVLAASVGLATGAYHFVASWIQRRWIAAKARWPRASKPIGFFVGLLLGSLRQARYGQPLREGERVVALKPDGGHRYL